MVFLFSNGIMKLRLCNYRFNTNHLPLVTLDEKGAKSMWMDLLNWFPLEEVVPSSGNERVG